MTRTRWPQARERLLWTTPAAVAIAARGDLGLHAAAVDVEGGAVLVTGPGGAGKTTTAAAFFRAGYRILADDLACCQPLADPALLPGPALLRVNPDTAEHVLGLRPESLRPSRAKVGFGLPADQRGDGAPVPLKAVVILERGSDDRVRVEPLPAVEAVRSLWASVFHLPGDQHQARAFQLLVELVGGIRAVKVVRPLDWDVLPDVVEQVAASLRE